MKKTPYPRAASKKFYGESARAGQIPLLVPDSDWSPPSSLPDLRGRPYIAADLENRDNGLARGAGPGWPHLDGYIVGACLAAEDISVYAPIRHPDSANLDPDRVREWWCDHMRCGATIIFQNGPFDMGWGKAEWDAPYPETLEDTMAAANALDRKRDKFDLDSLLEWVDLPGKDETLLTEAAHAYAGSRTRDEVKGALWKLPARYVGPYAQQDGRGTYDLMARLRPRLAEQDLTSSFRTDCDLLPLIVEMRRRGIRIDEDRAEILRVELLRKRDAALAQLSDKLPIGRPVTMKDVKSESFLSSIFRRENIPVPLSETGRPSFESDWMEKRDHWLPKGIADARRYHDAGDKFVGTYIQKHVHMGRIHSEIHPYRDDRGGTRTSRLAYSGPPLQQMPIRDEEIGPAIRSLFLPEKGEIWSAPDFSQQEYRLIVHFASVCGMAGVDKAVEIYQSNPDADFHQIVVELTGLIRQKAKDANFAKAYRAGVPKFALMIDQSEEEAAAIYKQYDEEMPFVSRLAEFCDGRAQNRGFLRLIDGSRAHFDRWEPRWLAKEKWKRGKDEGQPMNPVLRDEALARTRDPNHVWYGEKLRRAGTYKAMNELIQGSAARQTKMAMVACWKERIVPLIQMHDELSLSCAEQKTALRVQELMRDVVKLVVPVAVDLEHGRTWGHARKVKDPVTKKVVYGATWEEAWADMRRQAA